MLKRTPLFETHRQAGARLVEFGGWEMPVQYSSIVDEHHAVRKAAGLFDISHMGEISVLGTGSLEFLNATLTNDVAKLEVGQGQYTLMCNDRGGTIDDLYTYRLGDAEYLLIVNASRIEADFGWLQECYRFARATPGLTIQNQSAQLAAIAVQGPKAALFIDACFTGPAIAGRAVARPAELKKNLIAQLRFEGTPVWIARTGYTGEDGFEIVARNELIEHIWRGMMSAGEAHGLKPAGLGARDTLRTEMCYPLYGHELDEHTTPLEAGLGKFVALDKGDFVGRNALLAQREAGVERKCAAFVMTDRSAPPRPQYSIWKGDGHSRIGEVVSGTQSPTLNIGIGLGYVSSSEAKPGTPIQIEIRGKRAAAAVVQKPIYKKPV